MGKYIRPLSDAVFTIASDDLWIESLAIQQLHTTANLPNMQRVVGMPDLHPGRGYPIGAAFFSAGRFYPALVGNDIGCGMALWQTDILARKYNADKFEQSHQITLLHITAGPQPHRFQFCRRDFADARNFCQR